MRIYLIGYMGSGKTTIGKMIAEKLHMRFVDLDSMIEKKTEMTVPDIFQKFGEEKFRALEQNMLQKTSKLSNTIISTGGGTPCFFENMQFMNQKGTTIYLDLSANELATRLKTTDLSKRPLLAKTSHEALEKTILINLNKRLKYYQQAALIVRGDDETMSDAIIRYIQTEQEMLNKQ